MTDPFETLPMRTKSVKQERELVKQWRKTKNPDLLVEVVMNNMRQAVNYARRICREQFEDGDLIGICYTSMLRQAKRYYPSSPINFFTFAKIGVRGDVNRNFKQLDTIRRAKRVAMPIGRRASTK